MGLAGIQELFKLVPGFRREDVWVDAGFHRHDKKGKNWMPDKPIRA